MKSRDEIQAGNRFGREFKAPALFFGPTLSGDNVMTFRHVLTTVVIVLAVLWIANNVPAVGNVVGQ